MEALASPLALLIKAAPTAGAQGSAADGESGEISGDVFAALLAQQMDPAVPGDVSLEAVATLAAAMGLATEAGRSEPPPDQAMALLQLPLGMPNAVPNAISVPTAPVEVPTRSLGAGAPETALPGVEGAQQAAMDAAAAGVDDRAGNARTMRQAIAGEPASFAVSAGNARVQEGDSRFLRGMDVRFEQPVAAQAVSEMPASATPSAVGMPMLRSAADAPPVQASSAIAQPVTSNVWGDKLGERVVWMVGQQHQGVELHLNPPSLGPLEIKLSMSDNTASLTFSTQHPPVRDAIESATARLREMLAESGLTLGSVSVNVGNFTQQQPGNQSLAESRGQASAWIGEGAAEQSLPPPMITPVRRNGMVDIFA